MKRSMFGLLLIAIVSQVGFAGDWPQWRGPNRTDISAETGLLKQWPDGGPKRLWLYRNAGIGYSGFSVADGKLFTMGARDKTEYLMVLDADKGTLLFETQVGSLLTNNWGDGPRSTPTVDGDFVYALGGHGDLACVQISTQKTVWSKSMKDLGGKRPGWGYCESVLIDGDKVICTPGGKNGALVALNKKTGNVIWQTAEFKDGAQYSSPIIAEIGGRRQYIQLVMKNVVGVDAQTGKVIWKSEWPGRTAVIPTPIEHEGQVFISSGYGVGCKLVKVDGSDATDVYFNNDMINHHGGVILHSGHLYGYSDKGGWTCMNFATGEVKWQHRKHRKGAISYADGCFYCLEEGSGTIALIEASTDGWNEVGKFKLEPQTELRKPSGKIWVHPVISNGKMYLRDQDLIFCFDVKAN